MIKQAETIPGVGDYSLPNLLGNTSQQIYSEYKTAPSMPIAQTGKSRSRSEYVYECQPEKLAPPATKYSPLKGYRGHDEKWQPKFADVRDKRF